MLAAVGNVSMSCADALANEFAGSLGSNVNDFLMVSACGHGIGDLGDYSLCSQLPEAIFGWAGVNITYAIGLCVPSQCNSFFLLSLMLLLLFFFFHLL